MAVLKFRINGNQNDILEFDVRKMINAGYTGRNQEEVRQHIDELKELGIPAPEKVPTCFPKFADRLTQEDVIDTLDDVAHIGEAEYVLLCKGQEVYVTVGSDHTDRALEQASIPKAKQVYPNVISQDAWKLADVKGHWDDLELRAWIEHDGEKKLYQQTQLAALMSPDELLESVMDIAGLTDLDGLVIYSGTVAAIEKIDYSPYFEVELADKQSNSLLRCSYRLDPVTRWFKGKF